MPYYQAQGDYYRTGDPFLGALIGRALPVVGGLAKKVVGGLFKKKGAVKVALPPAIMQKLPKIGRAAGAIAAGGAAFELGGAAARRIIGYDEAGNPIFAKRRRMNVTNVKALRRAIRREQGFIRIARRTGLVQVPRAKFKKLRKR